MWLKQRRWSWTGGDFESSHLHHRSSYQGHFQLRVYWQRPRRWHQVEQPDKERAKRLQLLRRLESSHLFIGVQWRASSHHVSLWGTVVYTSCQLQAERLASHQLKMSTSADAVTVLPASWRTLPAPLMDCLPPSSSGLKLCHQNVQAGKQLLPGSSFSPPLSSWNLSDL